MISQLRAIVTRFAFFLACLGASLALSQQSQDVGRNEDSPQVTYEELVRRFRNQPPLPTAKISTPTSPSLSSETRYTENQHPYEFLDGTVERLEFNGQVPLDLCPHPDGSKLFAIFDKQAKVFIVDPAKLKIVSDFACPRFPVSLCCSAKNLAVACYESAVVSFFDLSTNELVAASTASLKDTLMPISLIGQAPDKRLISLWKHRNSNGSGSSIIVVIGEDEASNILGYADVDSCCFAKNSDFMIYQKMSGSPTGIPRVIGGKATGRLDFFSKTFPSKHVDHSPVFVSQNGSYFVLPRMADDSRTVGDYKTETIVFDREIEHVLGVIPGMVVAEYDGSFIALGRVFRAKKSSLANDPGRECEIRFVNCVTHKDERVIRIGNANGAIELDRNSYRVVFVPGHEILFIRPTQENNPWHFVRCGPLDAAKSRRVEKVKVTLRNMLPSILRVGSTNKIMLDVALEPANASVEFKLVKGPPGMKLDRKSGEINFLPNEVNLGECQAQLVCIVNESEYPLVNWSFHVQE